MDIQHQFPGVHWVWGGGISFVYEVYPLIVVKVPKSGQEEREKFRKELKIYEILSRHPPYTSLYMRDIFFADRRQFNLTRDPGSRVVFKMEKLESLMLGKSWMNDLAQGVPFLGSSNLAHGDLRPENILLDRDRLKLSDFDCTAEFGTDFETCLCPYGRLLNSNEADQGIPGTAGLLGPRAEQFALGSVYYFINYGFEVYDNQSLADDPYEHGPKVMDLLQDMKFPQLGGDPLIEDIINKCWHNQYLTLGDLATHTETFLKEPQSVAPNHEAAACPRWSTAINRTPPQVWSSLGSQRRSNEEVNNGDDYYNTDQKRSGQRRPSKEKFCQDLEKRRLVRLLTSSRPMELGFSMEHRHVPRTTPANWEGGDHYGGSRRWQRLRFDNVGKTDTTRHPRDSWLVIDQAY
ncbi:kinase-like domain-containing protein [Aspergillus pseudonomiae]|uniref:Kinase-like domain-containing protein n=1 Tax=Aspergillus pseudonomiae TaxID=1506151 RepID=A0A5N7DJS4_9EURO|nr:kinase-like domain-containing protein [Aspergillus pseudonomiae]KAE8406690.1 kinase-like domain-containing protein [Aspergillus pseudonomiae]